MFGFARDIPKLAERLIELEHRIAELRAEQVVVVNELNKGQAHLTDASRSLTEYVQAKCDVAPETARNLVFAGTTFGRHRTVSDRMAYGRITFDRAIATVAYLRSGATAEETADTEHLDLHEVRRRIAAKRRMTRSDERAVHAGRFFTAQPSLDRSRYRLWGELPGYEGTLVEKALAERGDEFRRLDPSLPVTRGQRSADALVAMARDSLDRPHFERVEDLDGPDPGRSTSGTGAAPTDRAPTATVFVDATGRIDTGGGDPSEATAEVAYGPRVGPDTLELILCTGSVRVVGMNEGKPVTTSSVARAIPNAIRAFVAARDGGCTIDGCASRYRLQPHHVQPWSHGGSHDPDNLTTLCWYHHHVAIHRSGFTIDPTSPPRRRRLVRHGPRTGADPP